MLAVLDAPVRVASDLVVALSNVIEPVLGDAATAGAIVAVTLAVRLLLLPLGYRAARATRARQAMRPEELRLRKRFRTSPARLRNELHNLHERHQTSRFAGMVPLLAQLPFFMVLYRLFMSPTVNGHANVLLTHTLLGVPLSDRWLADLGAGLLPPDVVVFGTVFVLLIAVAWWSSRQARQASAVTASASAVAGRRSRPADPATDVQAMVARVSGLMPYVTVVVAVFVPLATALYLLTTTTWSAAERWAFGTYRAAAPA